MHMSNSAAVAVVLPGSGSDAEFARQAFGPALDVRNITVVPVDPDPRGVVASYRAALDEAAEHAGRILAAGISIGAAVALQWALAQPDRVLAVLAAMPAWTGTPDGAPAAQSAAFTATRLRADGLASVTAQMQASSPRWLADTLTRSWAAHGPELAHALDEAAAYVAPDRPQLRRLNVPVGVVGVRDDAVHPVEVAQEWAALLPRSALAKVTLDEVGADPAVLGRSGLAALAEAGLRL